MEPMKPKVAVTMGDPAGIGPEICLDLLGHKPVTEEVEVLVFGDAGVLARVAEVTGKARPIRVVQWESWRSGEVVAGPAVVDMDTGGLGGVVPGEVSAGTGWASWRYVEAAIEAVQAKRVDAVATGPIHKRAWHWAGVPFAGHTELLVERTGARRHCMMLSADRMTCSLVTAHVGLREVAALVTEARVLEVIELTGEAVGRFCGRRPRLTVLGLNPHAGEGGLFGGGEEEKEIIPAVEAARERGWEVAGPLSPDTAFVPARLEQTDGYVCMYHDQGLIPLKMVAFGEAIQVTLGLPWVRTSVDHGTALEIAWQGRARAGSLVRAVEWAGRLAAGR